MKGKDSLKMVYRARCPNFKASFPSCADPVGEGGQEVGKSQVL